MCAGGLGARGLRRLRICQLVFSSVADDPRVRRHSDALAEAGHDVMAVGYRGGNSSSPGWPVSAVSCPSGALLRRIEKAVRVGVAPVRGGGPEATFWRLGPNREMFDVARSADADVWVANDWSTLPIAARLSTEVGGLYVYDSHEYAAEMGADRIEWRLRMGPYIRAMERNHIAGAAAVLTVATGIARLLRSDHALAVMPVVVRNVPRYEAMPYRPTGKTTRVLFHGALGRNRNLEAVIESIAYWPPDHELVVRGSGPQAYERRLRDLASRSEHRERIRFVGSAPMLDLVRLANDCDIGIHAIQGRTKQTMYSLPNKFFEYIMAGLALCVTDLPEMGGLVRKFGLGRTFREPDPRAIGLAVASLSPDEIEACKQRSLLAARELSWEVERDRLLGVFRALEERG